MEQRNNGVLLGLILAVLANFVYGMIEETFAPSPVNLHMQAVKAGRDLYQGHIGAISDAKIDKNLNSEKFHRDNLAIRLPESQRERVARIAFAITDVGSALLEIHPQSYFYGIPYDRRFQEPAGALDFGAEIRINRQCKNIVAEIDAILQAASRKTDSLSVNELTLSNLHTLRRVILELTFRSGAIGYEKWTLFVIESLVLIYAAWYLGFRRLIVKDAFPGNLEGDGFFDNVLWSTAALFFFFAIWAGAIWAGFSAALYGLQALLALSASYPMLSVYRIRNRLSGASSGDQSTLRRLITLLKSFAAGATLYFFVISVFSSMYFFGRSSTGLAPFALSRLNAAAFLWAFFFLLAGIRAQSRVRRLLLLTLGPILFIISIAYHLFIADWVTTAFPALASYPANGLYHLSYFMFRSAFPVHVEIILPRLLIALPLLFLVLQRFLHRKEEEQPIREFLGGGSKSLDLSLPFNFSARVKENGLLLFPLEDDGDPPASPSPTPSPPSQSDMESGPARGSLVGKAKHLGGSVKFSERTGVRSAEDRASSAGGVLAQMYQVVRSGRPLNILMALAMTLISYGVASAWRLDLPTLFLLGLSCALMVTGQFLFNDLMDLEIDRVSKPWRAVASGALSRSQALSWSLALTFAAILVSSLVGPEYFALCTTTAIGLLAYSLWLKRSFGIVANIVSSILTCSLCFIGPVVVGRIDSLGFISVAVFFACLAREIAKDVEDLEGDLVYRRRSLPMLVGERKSMLCAFACLFLQVAASYLPFMGHSLSRPYGVVVTIFNVAALSVAVFIFCKFAKPARQFQRAVKALMIAYLVAYSIAI